MKQMPSWFIKPEETPPTVNTAPDKHIYSFGNVARTNSYCGWGVCVCGGGGVKPKCNNWRFHPELQFHFTLRNASKLLIWSIKENLIFLSWFKRSETTLHCQVRYNHRKGSVILVVYLEAVNPFFPFAPKNSNKFINPRTTLQQSMLKHQHQRNNATPIKHQHNVTSAHQPHDINQSHHTYCTVKRSLNSTQVGVWVLMRCVEVLVELW